MSARILVSACALTTLAGCGGGITISLTETEIQAGLNAYFPVNSDDYIDDQVPVRIELTDPVVTLPDNGDRLVVAVSVAGRRQEGAGDLPDPPGLPVGPTGAGVNHREQPVPSANASRSAGGIPIRLVSGPPGFPPPGLPGSPGKAPPTGKPTMPQPGSSDSSAGPPGLASSGPPGLPPKGDPGAAQDRPSDALTPPTGPPQPPASSDSAAPGLPGMGPPGGSVPPFSPDNNKDAGSVSGLPPTDVNGKLIASGTISYRPEEGAFYLVDPAIEDLTFDQLPKALDEPVREVAGRLLKLYFADNSIYKLSDSDTKLKAAKALLKSVSVQDGRLNIELGL